MAMPKSMVVFWLGQLLIQFISKKTLRINPGINQSTDVCFLGSTPGRTPRGQRQDFLRTRSNPLDCRGCINGDYLRHNSRTGTASVTESSCNLEKSSTLQTCKHQSLKIDRYSASNQQIQHRGWKTTFFSGLLILRENLCPNLVKLP